MERRPSTGDAPIFVPLLVIDADLDVLAGIEIADDGVTGHADVAVTGEVV